MTGKLVLAASDGSDQCGAIGGAACDSLTAPDQRKRSSFCRVLVAEDNPVNQMVIRAMLQKLGIEAPQIIRSGFESRPVIVAVTANAMADDAERCRPAGMDLSLRHAIRPTPDVAT